MQLVRFLQKISLVLMLFLVTGCGNMRSESNSAGTEGMLNNSEAAEQNMLEVEPEIDRSGFDWRMDEWKSPKTSKSSKSLYVQDFFVGDITYEEVTGTSVVPFVDCCVWGGDYFVLDYRDTFNGAGKSYFVDRYNAEDGSCSTVEISAEIMNVMPIEEQSVTISKIDVVKENLYVLLYEMYSDGKLSGLEAIYIDSDGYVRSTTDLYQAFVNSGIQSVNEMNFASRGQISFDLMVDKDGIIYLSLNRTSLVIIDEKRGVSTTVISEDNGMQDYNSTKYMMSKDSDGGVILFSYCNNSNAMSSDNKENSEELGACYYYDSEKGLLQKKCAFDLELSRYCMTDDGFGYVFSYSEDLYRWDLYTGAYICLLNLRTNGIAENSGMVMISTSDQGNVCLYVMRDEIEMYVLSLEKPIAGEELSIVSLTENCRELVAAAADYSRRHPESAILVEDNLGDLEDRRTRLMADLVSGNGPAAMYVSQEDMELLYEKGLLHDLTGLLSERTEEQIFSGILDCGKVQGRQIGFPMTAELSTILVRNEVWSEDSWSVRDVIRLVKDRKYSQLETIIGIAPGINKYGFGGMGILQALVLENIENSPFLNLEIKECYFDSEEFIELLELVSEYDKINYIEEPVKLLEENRMLAYLGDERNVETFSDTMSELGENYHCVGFPTEQGNGSFWNCDYYLVVNKEVDNLDAIKGLMEYVYSYNRQMKNEAPIHREVYSRKVGEGRGDGYVSLYRGDMSYRLLKAKPDGSSWLDEFIKLAEEARPCSKTTEKITKIIREEVEPFFEGQKDAASVARTIQSRVWIYLNE